MLLPVRQSADFVQRWLADTTLQQRVQAVLVDDTGVCVCVWRGLAGSQTEHKGRLWQGTPAAGMQTYISELRQWGSCRVPGRQEGEAHTVSRPLLQLACMSHRHQPQRSHLSPLQNCTLSQRTTCSSHSCTHTVDCGHSSTTPLATHACRAALLAAAWCAADAPSTYSTLGGFPWAAYAPYSAHDHAWNPAAGSHTQLALALTSFPAPVFLLTPGMAADARQRADYNSKGVSGVTGVGCGTRAASITAKG